MRHLTLQEARRLLLAGQGLLDPPGRRASQAELYRLILQLGFVQVDSINVIERAHHLTLWSRLYGYRREWLERLTSERKLFEHWTHDASLIPTLFLPHWVHRFDRYAERVQSNKWWQERLGGDVEGVASRVEERIRTEGPLRSRDFEGAHEPGGWWGWKEPKAALEFLWRAGRLAIREREGFQKVYDLAERVYPASLERPSWEAHVDWACHSALERLGVGTPAEIAAYWHTIDLASARDWCRRSAEPVLVDGRPAFALPTLGPAPTEVPSDLRLLCPFDPILRDRKRALRLFGFDYRFEAFTPAPQRVYGYYVLPVLEGEKLVARLDPKIHRAEGRLAIQGVWWEPGVKVGPQRQRRLEKAVERLASFVGATRVDWGP